MADTMRPNLLFIMTDQQRFDALSCHGGWIKTPHLDRLAAEGVDLRGHFAQAPVCVPSRCTLFSGIYPHAHGVLENDQLLPGCHPHLVKVLRQQAYHLAYSGKNHMLPDAELAANVTRFDPPEKRVPLSRERQAYVQLEHEAQRYLAEHDCFGSGRFHDFPDEVTTSGMIAAQTLDDLAAAPADRPWCLVSSFSDPHVPHLAPRRFAALYPEDELPLPDWQPAPEGTKPRRLRVKRGAQGSDRADPAAQRHYLAVYGAMCSYVDELIGRIMAALRGRPDADRTIVVFVSDHGDFCWDQGMVKKDLLLYDALLRVPAIVHWPAHLPARVVAGTFTEHTDMLPTLLELLGVPSPAGCQGRSFAGLLRGETNSHRTQVHAEVCYEWMRSGYDTPEEYRRAWEAARGTSSPLARSAPFNVPGDHTRAVRTREWKYIWFGDGFEELYDLVNDPAESRNLAGDPRCAGELADMRRRLTDWQAMTPPAATDEATFRQHRQEYSRWDFSYSAPPCRT